MIVFAIAVITNEVGSTSPCDVSAEAYTLCSADFLCRARFFIHAGDEYDETRFHYLFSHYLFELNLSEEALNATCPLAHPLWLPLLRQAFFCTHNEYWKVGVGCVCQHDKICHESSGKDVLFDVVSFSLLVLLFIIVVVWCGVKQLALLQSLHTRRGNIRIDTYMEPVVSNNTGFVFPTNGGLKKRG